MKNLNVKYGAMILFSMICFAFSSPSKAQSTDNGQKLQKCLSLINENIDSAYNYAFDWRNHYGGLNADYCMALVDIGKGEYEKGAKSLSLISISIPNNDKSKTTILSQAANAYILANMPDDAIKAMNLALGIKPHDPELLIDRARSYALAKSWTGAEKDLNEAINTKGEMPLVLRLRAETKLQQKNYNGAKEDIEKAIKLAPKDLDNYVERGRIIEAQRTGKLD